ncbi:MAG: hypothetical protein K8R02_05580 [Anaerohalosphaeraceae bacterium]|nr:hypothetical protein [Anaerohalosphaeraceae bacterium]
MMRKLHFKIFTAGIFCLMMLGNFACASTSDVTTYIEQGIPLGAYDTAGVFSEVKQLGDGVMSEWPQDKVIFAGKLSHPQISALLQKFSVKVDADWFEEQGFQIATCKNNGQEVIIVTAPTDIGVLYGLIRIKEELEKHKQSEPFALNLNLRDKPAFKYRSAGPYANFRQYWGSFGGEDFTMEDFPEFFETPQDYESWVKGSYVRLEKLKKFVAERHKLGVKVYMHTKAPIVPSHPTRRDDKCKVRRKLVEAHPEILATITPEDKKRGVKPYFCWSSDILKQIVLKNFDRIFAYVPDLDGIVLVVHNGRGGYLYCRCDKCSKIPNERRLADLLASITKVMRKHNPDAKLILRDWGLAGINLSIDKLSQTLPDDVVYFTKLTVPPGNDYLWYDHFTPRINTPRLIAYGCNGFHANDNTPGHMFYLGGKMKARAIKMLAAGNLGTWSGDSPFGCEDLNPTAIEDSAWNPEKFDPLDHLERWAKKNFGKEAGKHVIDALYESYKITDFLIVDEYSTNTSQIFHWDPNRSMMYGQGVKQSEAVKNVNIETFDKLCQRYQGVDALKRADRMHKEIASAQAILPENEKLQRMLKWAKITDLLVKTSSNYNMALLNYNLYKNLLSDKPAKVIDYLKNAKSYIEQTRLAKNEYVKIYITIPTMQVSRNVQRNVQAKRYAAFVGEQVETGYDTVLTACTPKRPLYLAKGSSSLKSEGWPRSEDENIWRQGETLIIPDRLQAGGDKKTASASSLELTMDADLSNGALLRIQTDVRSKSGWRKDNQTNADIYIDGKLVGQIRRRVEGRMLHDYPQNKYATPAECWWAFVIPPQQGKTHTITIKALKSLKRPVFVDKMELRFFEK